MWGRASITLSTSGESMTWQEGKKGRKKGGEKGSEVEAGRQEGARGAAAHPASPCLSPQLQHPLALPLTGTGQQGRQGAAGGSTRPPTLSLRVGLSRDTTDSSTV